MEMLSHIKAGKAREKSGRLVVLNAFSIDNIFSLQEVYWDVLSCHQTNSTCPLNYVNISNLVDTNHGLILVML